mmetsp:Transcript_10627/g.22344  ORF Transcript_10627/g.22344 Transcript_10627/m.22344 type:complete len:211 (+) Transcript_10627:522-1154(+)
MFLLGPEGHGRLAFHSRGHGHLLLPPFPFHVLLPHHHLRHRLLGVLPRQLISRPFLLRADALVGYGPDSLCLGLALRPVGLRPLFHVRRHPLPSLLRVLSVVFDQLPILLRTHIHGRRGGHALGHCTLLLLVATAEVLHVPLHPRQSLLWILACLLNLVTFLLCPHTHGAVHESVLDAVVHRILQGLKPLTVLPGLTGVLFKARLQLLLR